MYIIWRTSTTYSPVYILQSSVIFIHSLALYPILRPSPWLIYSQRFFEPADIPGLQSRKSNTHERVRFNLLLPCKFWRRSVHHFWTLHRATRACEPNRTFQPSWVPAFLFAHILRSWSRSWGAWFDHWNAHVNQTSGRPPELSKLNSYTRAEFCIRMPPDQSWVLHKFVSPSVIFHDMFSFHHTSKPLFPDCSTFIRAPFWPWFRHNTRPQLSFRSQISHCRASCYSHSQAVPPLDLYLELNTCWTTPRVSHHPRCWDSDKCWRLGLSSLH
jgi:hypothetical protein